VGARLRAWLTHRSPRGVIGSRSHFREANINIVINDSFDPVTETPATKACAARMEPERTCDLH
jgi:hypothetical protein